MLLRGSQGIVLQPMVMVQNGALLASRLRTRCTSGSLLEARLTRSSGCRLRIRAKTFVTASSDSSLFLTSGVSRTRKKLRSARRASRGLAEKGAMSTAAMRSFCSGPLTWQVLGHTSKDNRERGTSRSWRYARSRLRFFSLITCLHIRRDLLIVADLIVDCRFITLR